MQKNSCVVPEHKKMITDELEAGEENYQTYRSKLPPRITEIIFGTLEPEMYLNEILMDAFTDLLVSRNFFWNGQEVKLELIWFQYSGNRTNGDGKHIENSFSISSCSYDD